MLNISKNLFGAWNDAKILYCHWKSNEHLLPGLNGETDLDVLLSREDKQKGESILRNLDFLQVRSQFGSRYPDVDDWIGCDNETGTLIHVHLHYKIVTGHKGMKEYSLPWTDIALCTRILNEKYKVYTMEPNLEMLTLYTRIGLKADFKNLLRCWTGKFRFPKDTQREIDWLQERVDKVKVRKLLDLYYGSKAKLMYDIIEKGKITSNEYLSLRKLTEEQFKNNSRIKHFVRLREILFYIYQTIGKKIVQKVYPIITKKVPLKGIGLSVAFIGQDGCGKSTVTLEIEKWLTWKIDACRFYLGSGDHYNGLLKRIIAKGVKFKNSNKKSNNSQVNKDYTTAQSDKIRKRKKNLKNFVAAFMVSLNHINVAKRAYKVIKQSEKYRQMGGIALFDRFPQNQFEGIYDGPKISTYYKNTGLDFGFIKMMSQRELLYISQIQNFQPNLVFKLLLPPEESIRRKPFEGLGNVRIKHEITQKLIFPHSAVYEVDAMQNYEMELIMIKNIIWKEIIKRQE